MNTAPDRWASASALFSDPVIQAVLGLLILSIVTMVAYFALSKLRDSNTKDRSITRLLEKNFEEMRSEGDINEQEFRKIKSLLAGGSLPAASAAKPTAPPAGTSQENDVNPSANL
jgi:hypothetical protein